MNNFRNLEIWQISVDLIKQIYLLASDFPSSEMFGLSSQIKRSANSVGANIAESSGRFHYKDRANFLFHARGSLIETEHHLFVSKELNFIAEEQFNLAMQTISKLSAKLNSFINKIKSFED